MIMCFWKKQREEFVRKKMTSRLFISSTLPQIMDHIFFLLRNTGMIRSVSCQEHLHH